ncbi:aliphatic sulfonate ABC transporter substrate-binding protein [Bacillus salipaludis]|uniref:ABC transporter substrate-binding protein n=1 Tax=Bacillus salipaludis TaxID=2547811 RepID=UPI002E222B38|nr:aliphatic sulfonate ABC transporter substrate-binding protein [Bacillus salipaludis]
MRKISFSLLSLFMVLTLAACNSQEKTTQVKADNKPVTVHFGILRSAQPLSLSEEGGPLYKRLEAAGAKIEKTDGFAAMAPAIEALNAGSIDITIGSITAGISALVGGTSEFTIFAKQKSDITNQGIVARPEAGIKNASDLKGKKIAVNRGGTGEYLLYKALDKAGLKASDVKIVYLPPTEAGPAFQSGKVDAWATWGSFTALAEEQYNANLVISAGDIDSENDTVYVVRNDFLKEHPKLVYEIFKGLNEEAELLAKDREKTVTLIKDTQSVTEQVARKQLEGALYPVENIDDTVRERWQGIADFTFKKGIIPKSVDLKSSTVDVTTN